MTDFEDMMTKAAEEATAAPADAPCSIDGGRGDSEIPGIAGIMDAAKGMGIDVESLMSSFAGGGKGGMDALAKMASSVLPPDMMNKLAAGGLAAGGGGLAATAAAMMGNMKPPKGVKGGRVSVSQSKKIDLIVSKFCSARHRVLSGKTTCAGVVRDIVAERSVNSFVAEDSQNHPAELKRVYELLVSGEDPVVRTKKAHKTVFSTHAYGPGSAISDLPSPASVTGGRLIDRVIVVVPSYEVTPTFEELTPEERKALKNRRKRQRQRKSKVVDTDDVKVVDTDAVVVEIKTESEEVTTKEVFNLRFPFAEDGCPDNSEFSKNILISAGNVLVMNPEAANVLSVSSNLKKVATVKTGAVAKTPFGRTVLVIDCIAVD